MGGSGEAQGSTKSFQARGRFRVARDREKGFAEWGADATSTEVTSSREAGPVDAADSESLADTSGEAATTDVGAS